jgi:hypothetical protein
MSTLDSFLHHPIETLEEALHIRRQIDALQKQLSSLFSNHPPSLDAIPVKSGPAAKAGKRTMSVEARERIAAAQRGRWAKGKGSAKAPAAEPAAKSASGKRFVSAESRAKMAAAQHARWARKNGFTKAADFAPKAPKGKRLLSPEGRARIVAALKARHAAAKKARA